MSTSLGLIIIFGLMLNALFTKLKLPGLIGMLMLGILMGPYGFDLIDDNLMAVSADFRKLALIIILLRAGLGINRDSLNAHKATALKMSFIPGLLEGLGIAVISIYLFDFTFIEGGILGFIIAAVSPAVVVPSMIDFIDRKIGTKRGIPTLILASSSLDDIVAITIFSTFLGLYSGSGESIGVKLAGIPVSILLGAGVGAVSGLLLVRLFTRFHMRDTRKVLYIIGLAVMLTAFESLMKSKVEIAGLLGVMVIGFIILELRPAVAKRLSKKFAKIWVFAEILLFVLVGAEVNIHVALDSGVLGLLLIFLGLILRSIGVIISTYGSGLNKKEILFTVFSYIPKATVQAAIGSIPLAMGVRNGELILALAVLSIVVTAPLGAILINSGAEKLLEKENL